MHTMNASPGAVVGTPIASAVAVSALRNIGRVAYDTGDQVVTSLTLATCVRTKAAAETSGSIMRTVYIQRSESSVSRRRRPSR